MRFFRRIKHLLYWLPIIWNDHDWDWGYFLTIVIHKLEAMQKFFQSDDAISADAKNVSEQIQAALVFLRNVDGDVYADLAHSVADENETLTNEDRIYLYIKAEKQTDNAIKHGFSIIGENLRNWWD